MELTNTGKIEVSYKYTDRKGTVHELALTLDGSDVKWMNPKCIEMMGKFEDYISFSEKHPGERLRTYIDSNGVARNQYNEIA